MKLFRLLDIKEQLLGSGSKMQNADFEEAVKATGHYREIAGTLFFTELDVENIVRTVSQARPSAQVLLNYPTSANERGWVVTIGDYHDAQLPVFVGWVPLSKGNGKAHLQELITQFGVYNHNEMQVLAWAIGTPEDVAEIHYKLRRSRNPGSHQGWMARTPEVNAWMESLEPSDPALPTIVQDLDEMEKMT